MRVVNDFLTSLDVIENKTERYAAEHQGCQNSHYKIHRSRINPVRLGCCASQNDGTMTSALSRYMAHIRFMMLLIMMFFFHYKVIHSYGGMLSRRTYLLALSCRLNFCNILQPLVASLNSRPTKIRKVKP